MEISTTGMVPAVVLLDAEGAHLHNALLQNDARAVREIEEVAGELGNLDVVSDTGSPLSRQSVAPTLRWFQRHNPQVWSATRHVAGSYDWVLIALGAKAHVERNWALESGLFYIDGRPHEAIIDVAGARLEQIPGVVSAGDVVGHLDAGNAEAMGLPSGVPLISGGADHILSA